MVGPTCTFKSGLAIDVAQAFPYEIISADSRLIYKGMDIGTSKPTKEERKGILHHMMDILEPGNDYSVALYKKDSEQKIKEIFSRDKVPLFVGGTGLYLNSVLLGLSIPEVKPDLSLRRQLKEKSQEELYQKLKGLDPKAAEIIHRNDNFRTVRALEVIYKTNKSFSSLKQIQDLPYDVCWIGLIYENRSLHLEKIRKRTETFYSKGFLEEVGGLLDKYGELDIFKSTIGYVEAIEFLKGNIKYDFMIEKIVLHTKQLAKRQATWFRANKNIKWVTLDGLDYKEVLKRALDLMKDGSFAKTSMSSVS